MARTIQLPNVPAGYSMVNALPGETGVVRVKEFLSSEDGNEFITRLEGVWGAYGPAFSVPPSQVDHFLAIVTKAGVATVYCNELQMVSSVRLKKPVVQGGGLVLQNDIADIETLELQDVEGKPVTIPPDCGVVFILSHGWRKGLFYDYSVFRKESTNRTDDLPRLFGHFYARLLFQEMYSIRDEQWRRLLEWEWFPFICLRAEDRRRLLMWAASNRDAPLPFFDEICRAFQTELEARMEAWEGNELLKSHMAFFKQAKDRYLADDYVSCISVLYPRIEGAMRTLFVQENVQWPNQSTMVSNLVENKYAHSVLLPTRFAEYLQAVYFRSFDQQAGEVPLSRHSIGHGISQAGDYNFIRASLGFMVIDQIFYYLSD